MRIFLALAILFLPSLARAGCLDTFTGPAKTVTGTTDRNNDWFGIADGTRFDARGQTFTQLSTTANYPIDIRSDTHLNSSCWEGGAVQFTDDRNATWTDRHSHNSAGILGYDTPITIESVRIDNAVDALRPFWTRDGADVYWTIKRVWVSYNRDDCIEDDWYAGGLVEDSMFDGCYVFLSTRGGSTPSTNTVTIRNSLIRMQPMPGPYGHPDPTIMGHGDIFKTNQYGPGLVLENNVFLVEGYATTKGAPSDWRAYSFAGLSLGQQHLESCKGNIIVWDGPGDYPGDIPGDPACVTVTKDKTVWENAKAKWIANHPNVMRLAGDPTPEPGLTQQMKDAVAAVVPAADAAVNENNLALDAAQKAVAAAQAALDLAQQALTAAQSAQAASAAADTKARNADCVVNGTC